MQGTRLLATISLMMGMTACATMSVSVSNVETRTQPVTAESSVFNVLGLNPTSIERIDRLRDSLNEQCGGRGVTGMVAIMSTTYAVIGTIEKVQLSGYCSES